MLPKKIQLHIKKILEKHPQYAEFLAPGPNKSIHPIYLAEEAKFVATAGLYRINLEQKIALIRILFFEETKPELRKTVIQRGLALTLDDAFNRKELGVVWTKIPSVLKDVVLVHRLFGFHSAPSYKYRLTEDDSELTALEATSMRFRNATRRQELQPD